MGAAAGAWNPGKRLEIQFIFTHSLSAVMIHSNRICVRGMEVRRTCEMFAKVDGTTMPFFVREGVSYDGISQNERVFCKSV